MDRREFVTGGVASMMGAMLGISPVEVETFMKEAEENPDEAITFLMDGTCEHPEITVQGVIKAIDFDVDRQSYDLYSDGMKYQSLYKEPTFTARFHGPFTMKFVDENKFWGRK